MVKGKTEKAQSAHYIRHCVRNQGNFWFFSLFDLANSVTIPKHQTNTNAILTEQVIIRFHKVNELYDGTPNKTLNLFNSTDITTN